MILFTILCILLIGGVFFYSSFALFEVKENFNIIKGNVENPGDLYFAYYIDDVVTTEMPNKDSGYTLSNKSSCTNGVTITWDKEDWTLLVNYSNYKQETNGRTKCTLYFEEASNGILRTISITDSKGMWQYKGQITKLIIEDKINEKEGAIANFDESSKQDKSVMSYVVENPKVNEEEETTYTAYLQSNEKLYLSSGENLFYNFQKLETIEGMRYIDTSNVITMKYMFNGCSSLTTLSVSNFNTEKVTNMRGMFYNCENLITLNLSHFDTRNVTDMRDMFRYCESLTDLEVSNFNTEKVTYMTSMFTRCSSLTTLNLNSFNTSNVENMSDMFEYCKNLATLDLSSFKTSNVTNMSDMFSGCSSLTILDLNNFNTEKVTDMSYMFNYCESLTTLLVSNFNTSNVESMSSMFQYCKSLTNLDVSNFSTEKVTNMWCMFRGCSSLTTIDVSNFKTEKVTNMAAIFDDCRSLTFLDLSGFNTLNVTNSNYVYKGFQYMFNNCSKLTEIIYGENFIHRNDADVTPMFINCPANKPTHESWSGITF